MNDDQSIDDEPDLFDEQPRRTYGSIEAIEQALATESAKKRNERHRRHTKRETKSGPETPVKARIRKHLEQHYRARVLRTNAGRVRDQDGFDVFLGEAGISDLTAIIPIEIDGFTFGIFAAVECKATGTTGTDNQEKYLTFIRARGGIGVVASLTIHVDEAIERKVKELTDFIRNRRNG